MCLASFKTRYDRHATANLARNRDRWFGNSSEHPPRRNHRASVAGCGAVPYHGVTHTPKVRGRPVLAPRGPAEATPKSRPAKHHVRKTSAYLSRNDDDVYGGIRDFHSAPRGIVTGGTYPRFGMRFVDPPP